MLNYINKEYNNMKTIHTKQQNELYVYLIYIRIKIKKN